MSLGRARRQERRARRSALRRAARTPRLGLPWLASALDAIEAICRAATPGAWIASETFHPRNPGWEVRRLVDFASAGADGLEVVDPPDPDPRPAGVAGSAADWRARREDWWFVATFHPQRVIRILSLLRAQVDLLRHLCDTARAPTCAHLTGDGEETRSLVGAWKKNPLVDFTHRCDRSVTHRCDRLGADPWICDLHRHRRGCCAPLDAASAKDWIGTSIDRLARIASAATPGSWRVGASGVIESVDLDAPVLVLRAQDGGPARAGDCAHAATIHPQRALQLLACLQQVSATANWLHAQPEFAMHGAGARIRAEVERRIAPTQRGAAALDPRLEARATARLARRLARLAADLPPDPRTNEGRHELAIRARQVWGRRAEMSQLQTLGHWMCARINFRDEPSSLLGAPACLLRDAAQSVDQRIRATQEERPSARQRKRLRWLLRWRDRIAAEVTRQAGVDRPIDSSELRVLASERSTRDQG